MSEYRPGDLARISGVSARNIRAYRERGLLDPPRREGRSAYYDDYHLAQLETINQLLRKGFNSTHIADFFATMREGADLADILGLQRAVLGPRRGQRAQQRPAQVSDGAAATGHRAVQLDPASEEARRLLDLGLAEPVDGAVRLVDPALAEIVARAAEPMIYVRAIVQIFESTRENIDALANAVVKALEECLTARFGPHYLPKPEQMPELSQIVQDYRDLANKVVVDHLDAAVQQQMVSSVSGYTAGILLSGRWEPKSS